VLIFTACDDELKAGFVSDDELKEGFVSDDAYHVIGKGRAAEEHRDKNPMIISKIACEGAILDAQGKAIHRFAGAGLDTVKGKVSEEEMQGIIIRKFSGTVKRGRTVKTYFNESTLECVVVYEIKEEGLKEKIRNAAEK
jgi:hypothetical protein